MRTLFPGPSTWRLVFLVLVAPYPFIPGCLAGEPIAWVDSARDLYIDGRLDRDAQLFLAEDSGQAAVVSDALPEVVVFDRESLAVGTLDRKELAPTPDRTQAASPRLATLDAAGEILRVDDRSLLIRISGQTVLVAPHQGLEGEITRDELWRTVPVWRARLESYEPDPQVVAALKKVERDLRLTVVFGTWCGDSKQHVPELLRTIDQAANSRIKLKLVSIRRGFEEPLDFIRDQKVINVPTVIISGASGEIGRIVETPALDSIAADLAAILAGRTPAHPGRWERERRLARGTYHYLVDGSLEGAEEWEIFAGPDDATLIHSRLQAGARVTATWHRRDAGNVTNFLEITRQDGSDLSRSRFWIEGGRARSVTRGSATGIIEQTVEFPDRWTVLMPLAVDAVVPADGNPTHAFRFGAAGAPTSGRLYPLELEQGGSEAISTPAGRFDTARVVRRVAGEESVWWLHPELRVPVQGEREDGVRVVLVEIESFIDEPAEP